MNPFSVCALRDDFVNDPYDWRPKDVSDSLSKEQPLEAIIGLEVHAQISSQTKLFSCSPSQVFGQSPNTSVSFVDVAFPGMLPVVNKECINKAILMGLSVKGEIRLVSIFERKHYFYPDLPAGYQISQYRFPIIEGGYITILDAQGRPKNIYLQRIHLEQDAGQSTHDGHFSYVNLNRAGIGLMEIVCHPELKTAEEAVDYLKRLRCLMRYLGVCQGDMEKGHLRVDANVSVHYIGQPLGTRVELKNMNSFKFLYQAISYEIDRQTKEIRAGRPIIQETRTFDVEKGETRVMRTKEMAADYCYLMDPDLPPLVVSECQIKDQLSLLPELPWDKYNRFVKELGLLPYDSQLLTEDKEVADFFEKTIAELSSPDLYKVAANWIIGDVFAALNRKGLPFAKCPISPHHLAQLILCLSRSELSSSLAKEVFVLMWESQKSPQAIMQDKNLNQVSDEKIINQWVQNVLAREAPQVNQYLSGKEKVFTYLVGQVMKESKGAGNPVLISQILRQKLAQCQTSNPAPKLC